MKVTDCKVCGEACPRELLREPPGGATWHRCLACGSDSSSSSYETVKHIYDANYAKNHSGATREQLLRELRANVSWFGDHRDKAGGRDFLDVGHLEGACLEAMQSDGWSVHGFDVIPSCDYGPHTTIAAEFRASLFPQQYHAVMCREVLEHVGPWRQFLYELYKVTAAGGLLQLQTPRPWWEYHPIPYQAPHLQLFSPLALRHEVLKLGFRVIDYRFWDMGQGWLLRKEDAPYG